MPSFRIVSIVIFSIMAAVGLYTYVFRSSPSISPSPTPTPAQSPSDNPIIPTPAPSPTPTTPQQINLKNNMHTIILKTNLGDITFETYDADAPKTVQNFITLSQKGFYNNLIFHRVIKGFMIQGGDPQGTGMGGPGYSFEDELNPATDSYKEGYKKGVIAMANAGPNTNGSQFFIMLEDTPLPKNYTIFGKVVSGQNAVDAIGNVTTDGNDKPTDNVIIKSVTVDKK
ncbi:MAG: peptidylprolyl isomerase [Candidatus Sungbacteria bacterium]|nr:peptidylprolyl isomerase [bacterium]MDZ4260053.1 peptidylprolyl isomerase [Candidatus Sungbacteria bacterium]